MFSHRFFNWLIFILLGVVLSVLLAIASEAFAYQHTTHWRTPGIIVAEQLVPPRASPPVETFTRSLTVSLAIDIPIYFLLICVIAFAINRYHRKV